MYNYMNCEVACYLTKKEEPLSVKVPIDDMTDLAQECFDYEFEGESKFYPYELPDFIKNGEFNVVVITGASGKGKSTLLKEFPFYKESLKKYDCSKSVISNFSSREEALDKLSSVGLSSVPVWVKPRNVLSVGEGFRADLALNIGSEKVFDEFTSVVDRNVAISTANSIKKYIKKNNLNKIVFSSCHKDYIDYLEPDYVIDLDTEKVYDCRGVPLKKESSCQYTRSMTTQRRLTSGEYLGSIII